MTIVNLVNPTFSGYFSSWKIEVLDGDSIVLESKVFSQAIFIGTGDLVTSFTAGNNYKYAKTQYVFYINLKNQLDSKTKLFINFTNHWNLYSTNCSIITGVEPAADGSPASCQRVSNANNYQVFGYASASPAKQIIISVSLESPQSQGTYPISF